MTLVSRIGLVSFLLGICSMHAHADLAYQMKHIVGNFHMTTDPTDTLWITKTGKNTIEVFQSKGDVTYYRIYKYLAADHDGGIHSEGDFFCSRIIMNR